MQGVVVQGSGLSVSGLRFGGGGRNVRIMKLKGELNVGV